MPEDLALTLSMILFGFGLAITLLCMYHLPASESDNDRSLFSTGAIVGTLIMLLGPAMISTLDLLITLAS